jgi:hypothetical protein
MSRGTLSHYRGQLPRCGDGIAPYRCAYSGKSSLTIFACAALNWLQLRRAFRSLPEIQDIPMGVAAVLLARQRKQKLNEHRLPEPRESLANKTEPTCHRGQPAG